MYIWRRRLEKIYSKETKSASFEFQRSYKKKIVDLEEILFEWEESCGEEEVSMGCPEMILRVKIINAPR